MRTIALVLALIMPSVVVASDFIKKIAEPFVQVNKGSSGFVIKHGKNRTYILTAFHVIQDDKKNIVGDFFKFNDDGSIDEVVRKKLKYETGNSDVNIDYAILSVEGIYGTPVEMERQNDVKIFDKVYTVGAPSGQVWARQGIVSALTNCLSPNTDDMHRGLIGYDAGVWYGASGSALCNEEKKAIGIITQLDMDKNGHRIEQMGYAVPLLVILDDLDKDEREKYFDNDD